MTGTLFERTLATADIEAAFADAQVIVAMLAFEAALADAEADEGLIPRQAAAAIVAACSGAPFDVEWIVGEGGLDVGGGQGAFEERAGHDEGRGEAVMDGSSPKRRRRGLRPRPAPPCG